MKDNASSNLPGDETFAIKISESMEIRNALRRGLFEAQGKESDKIPLYVSWPSWLEDGIVCLYASDLNNLLRKAVRDSATSFARLIGDPDEILPEITKDSAGYLSEKNAGESPDNGLFEETSEFRPGKGLAAGDSGIGIPSEKKKPKYTDEAVESGTLTPKKEKSDKSQSFANRLFKNLTPGDSPYSSEEPAEGTNQEEADNPQAAADALFKKLKSGDL